MANNMKVLHTTPCLKQSLKNIHKLLVPGGYLLLVELCTEDIITSSVMGLLPGWWLGEADGRVDKPYISLERWDNELRSAGFTGVDAKAYDMLPPYHSEASIISRTSIIENTETQVSFLYDGTTSERARMVEEAFRTAGYSVEWFTLERIPANRTVVALLDLDEPFFDGISENNFVAFRSLMANSTPKSILWLTQDTQMQCKDPRWSLTFGIARTMRLEFSLPFITFEMSDCNATTLQSLIKVHRKIQSLIDSGVEPDQEYSAHDNAVFTSRYHLTAPYFRQVTIDSQPRLAKKLTIGAVGLLDTLQWREVESRPPGCDEIEVDIKCVGLNFKDMMVAMGYISSQAGLGFEAVGIVRSVGSGPHHQDFREGDRVSLLDDGMLQTLAVVKSERCVKLPQEVYLEDAATIPCVYSTVIHSLLDIGQLSKGQSVLIHSACGGVGIAAIQLCKMVGAEIFATVGNEAKKQYLTENYDIPWHRIFNSRDISFKQGVLGETNGRGVDIVLNSLSGEGLHASWECVAAFGKMIEIGKRDMMGRGKLNMDLFLDNRSFFGVDLHHMAMKQPERVKSVLLRAMEYFRQGKLKAIQPQIIFNAQDVEMAFRKMQGGQHMGKILIRIPEDTTQIPSLPLEKSVAFDSDAAYLLVGGFGGLGIAISRWMVEKGARNLVFLSRSAGTTSRCRNLIKELEEMGCTVKVSVGNVSNIDDVQDAVALCSGRLAGVIQLAMNLKDQSFANMTYDDWKSALDPKVEGTRNLYYSLRSHNLDFLVVFSSVVGVYGNAGQANYAAANSFLDIFVKSIRHSGFPASVIDLAAVEDIGHVSQDEFLLKRYRQTVAKPLVERDVLEAVQNAILEARSASADEDYNMGRIITGLQPFNRTLQTAFSRDRRFAGFNQPGSALEDSHATEAIEVNKWIAEVDETPSMLLQQSSADFLLKEINRLIRTYSGEPNTDELDDEAAGDIAVDSLMAIEIHSWLRKRCRVEVTAVKVAKAKNVKGLTALVLQALKTKYKLESPES